MLITSDTWIALKITGQIFYTCRKSENVCHCTRKDKDVFIHVERSVDFDPREADIVLMLATNIGSKYWITIEK